MLLNEAPAQKQITAVVSHLRERWEELFRLTTVEQAMIALGLPNNDHLRLAIGDELRAHPDLHPALIRWGQLGFILTEDEKLLGRTLTHSMMNRQGQISVAKVATALDGAETDVEQGLHVLRHVGLLDWHRAHDAISYTLAPRWQDLVGPLGFTYHTVQLEYGERFNVP